MAVIMDRSTYCGRQFEHEPQFCEICALTPERRPEGLTRFCLQELKQQARDDPKFISNFIRGDEIRCMIMTLRINSIRRGGNSQIPRTEKIASISQQYQVHSDFFDIQGIVERNSYPLVKMSLASFT